VINIREIQLAQQELPPKVTDQNIKFLIVVDDDNKPLFTLDLENDVLFCGHFRVDRASVIMERLQEAGLIHALGLVKYSDKYVNNGGRYILPKKVLDPIEDNYFQILFNDKNEKGESKYTVKVYMEDEKKSHMRTGAYGRREKCFPNMIEVILDMLSTTCEYADAWQMNMLRLAEMMVEDLDNFNITDIVANLLSSDMLKHSGIFEVAKRANEITDQALEMIKKKIDEIARVFLEEVKEILKKEFRDSDRLRKKLIRALENKDFNEFLDILEPHNEELAGRLKKLSKRVPIWAITADHGASEDAMHEEFNKSSAAHTANNVPYIIYDPLNNRKRINLKKNKSIANNAATLLHLRGHARPDSYEESLLPDRYEGYERRIVSFVLDGWGINPDKNYPWDAIRLASTPTYDWLMENAWSTEVAAGGEAQGLRKFVLPGVLCAGTTDRGHMALFNGRVEKQPIVLTDDLIKGDVHGEGKFDKDAPELKELIKEMKYVAANKDRKFCYLAVTSEGGVHSVLTHMYAMMRLAKEEEIGLSRDQFVIIFVADGRDTAPRCADKILAEIEQKIEEIGMGTVIPVAFGRANFVRKLGEAGDLMSGLIIKALTGDMEGLKEALYKLDAVIKGKGTKKTVRIGRALTSKEEEEFDILMNKAREGLINARKRRDSYEEKIKLYKESIDFYIQARGILFTARNQKRAEGIHDELTIARKEFHELRNSFLEDKKFSEHKALEEIRKWEETGDRNLQEALNKTPSAKTSGEIRKISIAKSFKLYKKAIACYETARRLALNRRLLYGDDPDASTSIVEDMDELFERMNEAVRHSKEEIGIFKYRLSKKQEVDSEDKIIIVPASKIESRARFVNWLAGVDRDKTVVITAMSEPEYKNVMDFEGLVHIKVVNREWTKRYKLKESQILKLDEDGNAVLIDLLAHYGREGVELGGLGVESMAKELAITAIIERVVSYNLSQPYNKTKELLKILPEGATVLGLGCGPARDEIWLAENGCKVVATDNSKGRITELNKRIGEEHIENISAQVVDIAKPFPFEEGKFDAVFCGLTFHTLTDTETELAVKEIARVLKPGGIVIVTGKSEDELYARQAGKRDEKGMVTVTTDDGTTYKRNYLSIARLRKLFSDFGIKTIVPYVERLKKSKGDFTELEKFRSNLLEIIALQRNL
jgi:bisphosphoglycerate-independent phosphoglycerate mutase (AlkP superfamily)/ubiquinone/menaquinone biosynthesis C-methylase UbiE